RSDAHALHNRRRDAHARHFVVQEFRIAERDERPDARDNRDAHMLYALQKVAQLFSVEDGLRDGVLRTSFHLPLETFDLFVQVERARIDAEDRKSTRLNSSHSQISYAVFC